MCGIAGILIANQNSEVSKRPELLRCLKKMTDSIAHRGPDGEGFWSNDSGNILLGHRRLSVIDLSAQAAQPMHYYNRYTIVHNGEIYNYIEIRSFLQQKGYTFQSHSDTEVIVAAFDYWNENCLRQFDGMFSFAIWDEKEQQLFAARDRFGEKPFYYYEDDEHFIFASEMKALWAAGVEKTIDNKMLLNYLVLGHVQNSLDKEQTFFQDIYSLPPAHFLKFNLSGFKLKTQSYWSLNKELKIDITADDAIERFTELFSSSLKRRLRSDVVIGATLSGGIDSSSIIANIRQNNQLPAGQATNTFKTFSAVFPGFEKDESEKIKLLTGHLGVNNFQVQTSADQLISDFEKLCFHQEEPFQSSGIFVQYKVFELAKQQHVKVLLDGQGADEILAGYPRYIHWYLQEVLNRHKLGATEKEKKALQKNNLPFRWNIKNYLAAFMPAHAAIQLEKNEYRKIMSHPDINPDLIRSLTGHEWEGIHKPIVTKLNDILHFNTVEMGLEELLRFADRNSMAHAREVRLPFLNHDLVEFVFSLPARFKIHNGWTKWLFRQAMNKKLPDEIVWNANKIGYEPPQQQWMQNPDLQDHLHEARRKLVDAKILSRKILDKKIEPRAAYAENNFDWKCLCAAQII